LIRDSIRIRIIAADSIRTDMSDSQVAILTDCATIRKSPSQAHRAFYTNCCAGRSTYICLCTVYLHRCSEQASCDDEWKCRSDEACVRQHRSSTVEACLYVTWHQSASHDSITHTCRQWPATMYSTLQSNSNELSKRWYFSTTDMPDLTCIVCYRTEQILFAKWKYNTNKEK